MEKTIEEASETGTLLALYGRGGASKPTTLGPINPDGPVWPRPPAHEENSVPVILLLVVFFLNFFITFFINFNSNKFPQTILEVTPTMARVYQTIWGGGGGVTATPRFGGYRGNSTVIMRYTVVSKTENITVQFCKPLPWPRSANILS